jgi:hypothetical protein
MQPSCSARELGIGRCRGHLTFKISAAAFVWLVGTSQLEYSTLALAQIPNITRVSRAVVSEFVTLLARG